jgi:hypothetical protein
MRLEGWPRVPVLPILRDAAKRPLLRMRSKVLTQNNLMLRSERRERLEASATADSPISDSQYWYS